MTARDDFVVPHSIEAEQSILGALMLDNDAIDRLGELRSEHFYRAEHRTIFDAIQRLVIAGKSADVVTVFEVLASIGKAEAVGGISHLNSLVTTVTGAAGIARWAEIVVERWKLRGILAAADEIGGMVYERSGKTASEIIAAAQAKFEPLSEARAFDPKPPGATLTEIVTEIDERYHGGELVVVPTGFRDLDEKLGGGMRGSELIIVAGRPSMGKTALSMGVACSVAKRQPVLVFSLEMAAKQLHQRNIAQIGGVPLSRVLDGKKFLDEDWPRLTHAVQVLGDMQLFVDDTSGLTLPEIVSRSRMVKRKHGLGLIVVDYLGLMTGGTDERQDLRIGSYSSGLKGLAKQLDVPVIALAQLNRGVEHRTDKRPTMGDLRDSGAIEQDADTILLLYRDEVYHPGTPDMGTAEIIIGKQRQGETGTVRLTYQGEYTRFGDLAPGYAPPVPRKRAERAYRDDM